MDHVRAVEETVSFALRTCNDVSELVMSYVCPWRVGDVALVYASCGRPTVVCIADVDLQEEVLAVYDMRYKDASYDNVYMDNVTAFDADLACCGYKGSWW